MGLLIGFILLMLITSWVYRDAKKRGHGAPGGWALLVACCLIIFLPLDLMMRKPLPGMAFVMPAGQPTLCATCGKYSVATSGSNFCALCGAHRMGIA
jgi:biotin transporter BioY